MVVAFITSTVSRNHKQMFFLLMVAIKTFDLNRFIVCHVFFTSIFLFGFYVRKSLGSWTARGSPENKKKLLWAFLARCTLDEQRRGELGRGRLAPHARVDWMIAPI